MLHLRSARRCPGAQELIGGEGAPPDRLSARRVPIRLRPKRRRATAPRRRCGNAIMRAARGAVCSYYEHCVRGLGNAHSTLFPSAVTVIADTGSPSDGIPVRAVDRRAEVTFDRSQACQLHQLLQLEAPTSSAGSTARPDSSGAHAEDPGAIGPPKSTTTPDGDGVPVRPRRVDDASSRACDPFAERSTKASGSRSVPPP
jgi:hypothetical protein